MIDFLRYCTSENRQASGANSWKVKYIIASEHDLPQTITFLRPKMKFAASSIPASGHLIYLTLLDADLLLLALFDPEVGESGESGESGDVESSSSSSSSSPQSQPQYSS